MPLRQNAGHCPAEAKGKRIRGKLRNGHRFGFGDPVHPSWSADTTRWSIEPEHPFDLVEWEVI